MKNTKRFLTTTLLVLALSLIGASCGNDGQREMHIAREDLTEARERCEDALENASFYAFQREGLADETHLLKLKTKHDKLKSEYTKWLKANIDEDAMDVDDLTLEFRRWEKKYIQIAEEAESIR